MLWWRPISVPWSCPPNDFALIPNFMAKSFTWWINVLLQNSNNCVSFYFAQFARTCITGCAVCGMITANQKRTGLSRKTSLRDTDTAVRSRVGNVHQAKRCWTIPCTVSRSPLWLHSLIIQKQGRCRELLYWFVMKNIVLPRSSDDLKYVISFPEDINGTKRTYVSAG